MYTLISSSSPLRFNWVVFFTAALASGWSFPFPLAALSAAFFSLGVFAFPSSFSILNLSSVAWKERTFFLPNHTVSKQWFFYSQVDLLCTHLFHHCLLIYSIFRPRECGDLVGPTWWWGTSMHEERRGGCEETRSIFTSLLSQKYLKKIPINVDSLLSVTFLNHKNIIPENLEKNIQNLQNRYIHHPEKMSGRWYLMHSINYVYALFLYDRYCFLNTIQCSVFSIHNDASSVGRISRSITR